MNYYTNPIQSYYAYQIHKPDRYKNTFEYLLSCFSDTYNPDGIESYFGNKSYIMSHRINHILDEIDAREYLKERNTYTLIYKDLQFSSKLLQLDEWDKAPGINQVIDKRRAHLERTLLDIEKAKMQEDISCWRDIANLKKELRGVMADYLDLKRKEKWLE